MNDADNTPARGLTTEQIATAGTTPTQADVPAPAGDQAYGDQAYGDQAYGDQAYGDQGYKDDMEAPRVADESRSRVSLLEDDELQSMTMRWKDIQAEFVDEPKEAVKEADALVAELMQRLAAMFATERSELEHRWAGGNQVSTEDLRQGLRRYHSFFERLLAA
jgi:hypothetical protein